MIDNIDAKGIARYPVGSWPIMDPQSGDVLVDALGRRSYTTSVAYGPTIGKNIALGYLPYPYCQNGQTLLMEYFHEPFAIKVETVGYKALYDPENLKPKT